MPDPIDLNVPYFTPAPQEENNGTAPEETVVEPEVENNEEVPAEESVEETKVPYSRFKKFHDRALEAEREAAEWRQRAETFRPERSEPEVDPQDEAYQLWIENFGDNEAAHKAWKNQLKITETLEQRAIERAEKRAVEAVREHQDEEVARTEQNVEMLDENFEDLEAFVGRDLSDKEQSAVLDIVDEYTPKDDRGNYAGAILPFEKAWEIYELKSQAGKAPKAKARDGVASLTGQHSQGDTNITEKDKNFNPMDWDSWRNRVSES